MDVERKVTELYELLWREIESIESPEIIDQFLFNVSLPRDWFKGKVCLDVGCGSGFAVWVMQELGAVCHACDLGYNALQCVRERLNVNKPLLVNASALALPFRADTFDFIHCNGVLHHTLNPRQGFSECARVSSPGGILFIALYGKGGIYNSALRFGRTVARVISYRWMETATNLTFGNRKVPNSFMPAKVSVLDNLYVPIREQYREDEVRRWYADEGFVDVERTQTTIYNHEKAINRLIHGEGYLQFRGRKRNAVSN